MFALLGLLGASPLVAHSSAQISVNTQWLNFGGVPVNSIATQNITLSSTGSSPATISWAWGSGAPFSVSGASFPITLNPGATLTLKVSFNPTAAGFASGNFILAGNGFRRGETWIYFNGSGVASQQLSLSSSSLAFGNVGVNTISTQALTLTAAGSSAVTVNSVAASGSGFTLTNANFPAKLNPGQSLKLAVSFKPIAAGALSGSLVISSAALTGGSATVALNGTGAAPQLTLSQSSLAFGNAAIHTASSKTLTLTSSGNAAVTVNAATVAGTGFTLSAATFPTTLPPGQSISLTVGFDPTVSGSSSGSLTIASNSSTGSTATVPLSGTGIAPQLTVSSSSLTFGNVPLHTTATQALTLTSSGTAPVTVNAATLNGAGYSLSGGTFPLTLNPGQTAVLQIGFDPTAAGRAGGSIVLSSNSAVGATTNVSLNGTGVSSSLTLSATSLSFGNVILNSTATQTLTLTSGGSAPVTVNAVAITGSGYTLSGGTFPTTLNPGQSISLQVSFRPTLTGAAAGAINVSSTSATTGTATVALTGTGTAPQLSLSAASLSFGSVNLNSTSSQNLVLTSSGTASVTVTSAVLNGAGFSVTGGTFPVTLNPGQTISLQVTFTPTATGAASGTIVVTSSSATAGTSTINLSGTGAGSAVLSLSTSALSFGNDPVGTPETLSVTLTSTGTAPVTISGATLTGAGFSFTGATFPVTLNPTVAITIQVLFKPAATGSAAGALAFASNSSTGTSATVSLSGSGTPVQHQVSLSWAAPANSPVSVISYNIYRATGTSTGYQLINSSSNTAYVDLSVQASTAYTYYVTGVASSGAESVASNYTTVSVPQ